MIWVRGGRVGAQAQCADDGLTTIDARAVIVDFAPTILEWAELPYEESHQGRSLALLVPGEKVASLRTDFFCEHLFVQPEIPM